MSDDIKIYKARPDIGWEIELEKIKKELQAENMELRID